LSNNANRAVCAAANPANPQIAVPNTSASPAPDQLSPKSVFLLPTTHPPSTSLVPADAASRHILSKVLEQLKEEDKRVVEAFASSDDEISSVLSTVYAACKEKKELCEKKGRFTAEGLGCRLLLWLVKRLGNLVTTSCFETCSSTCYLELTQGCNIQRQKRNGH